MRPKLPRTTRGFARSKSGSHVARRLRHRKRDRQEIDRGGNIMPWFTLALFVAALALIYVQARASWWLAALIVWVAAAHVSGAAGPLLTTLLAIVFVLPALVLTIRPLRR